MTVELWLIYVAAAVGLSLTPGPNGLLALSHGAAYGMRPASCTVLGGATGFLALIALSLAGFGALLAASETAFLFAKLIGGAYLVFLGVGLWRAPPPEPGVAAPKSHSTQLRVARPARLFRQGFFVAVSNPKGLLFFAAFLPQFMSPDASFWTHLFVLGGTFVAIEIAYELIVAGMAQRIAPWLSRHGRAFNRATGAAFAGLGAMMAATAR